jgi:hypothetical protein
MEQLLHDQFDDNNVVEISNDRNVVRKNVFRVCKVDKHREQAFAISARQLPLVVGQHLNE